jgi:hypothetical protein
MGNGHIMLGLLPGVTLAVGGHTSHLEAAGGNEDVFLPVLSDDVGGRREDRDSWSHYGVVEIEIFRNIRQIKYLLSAI